MSTHPDVLLEKLEAFSQGATDSAPSPAMVAHFLALYRHQEQQLAALRELKAKPTAPAPTDETICQEADRLVSFDRQQQYGHPREDFQRTAAMWEALLGMPPGSIDPEKVAYCMIALKLSRLCHGWKRDSIVDIAGYAKAADICHAARPQS